MIDQNIREEIELLRQTSDSIQENFVDKLKDYGNNWSLALQLLNEGASHSKSRHALDIFSQLNSVQKDNVDRLVSLLSQLDEFSILLDNSPRVQLFSEVPSFTQNIDTSKIEDAEDFLKLHNFLYGKVNENSILKLQYFTSVPTVCVYYLLELDYCILQTFLNKPTAVSTVLDKAIFIAKEIGKQVLDFSFQSPFTSIVDTIIKFSRSFIDEEIKKMNDCVKMLDRLFFLSDHCNALNNSISSTENLITKSLNSLKEEEVNFVQNFSLLKSLWLNVNR